MLGITNKVKKYKNFLNFSKKFFRDFNPSKDYYKTLGISNNATEKEIKTAYYKLAKIHHPDLNKGKNSELFKEITAAYDTLSDQTKRKEYDASRSFNNFFGGANKYSSQQNTQSNYNYNNSNFYNNFRGTNYSYKSNQKQQQQQQYEDPLKGFNDFFKNFYQKYNQDNQTNYKKDFSSGSKNDHFKSYYNKNKNYFASFKRQDQNKESNEKSSENKTKPKFGQKYHEKNKKYYENFNKVQDDQSSQSEYNNNSSNYNTNENTNQQTSNRGPNIFLIFFASFCGIIIAQSFIRAIFFNRKPNTNIQDKNPNEFKVKRPQSQVSQPKPEQNVYQGNYFDKVNTNSFSETASTMQDDPFYKKSKNL